VRKNDLKKQTKRRKQKLQQKRKQLKCTLKSTQHLDKNIILAFTHYKKNTHSDTNTHPHLSLSFTIQIILNQMINQNTTQSYKLLIQFNWSFVLYFV